MEKLGRIVSLLTCMLAASSCATPEAVPPAPPSVLEVKAAALPPAPADVMVQRAASFQQRLLDFFSASPEKPTTSPANSPPARP
jgi:hypothetical protein